MNGRSSVYAVEGMVATSHPLAAGAGIWALGRGGTAVDAALATAIALTVLEPTSNGLGSDAFALVLEDGVTYGYNGSGAAPLGSDPELIRAVAVEGRVPERGPIPITVPGAPRAWADLHARFGRLPWDELFVPARRYARSGFPLPPRTAWAWERALAVFSEPTFHHWRALFSPTGFTPRPGVLWSSPDHAATFDRLASEGVDPFYRGSLASRITEAVRSAGGWLSEEDLAAHEGIWVEPLSAVHHGIGVLTLPPNSQGLVLLETLQILEAYERTEEIATDHELLEATKRAFADALESLGDPGGSEAALTRMLDHPQRHADHALALRDLAWDYVPPDPYHGGTVYVATADGEGRLVSYIQSNYMGFGSGIVVPGTGIALQNRGACFTLRRNHPNEWLPGRRPYHTLVPSLAIMPDGTRLALGVVGGFFQPQGQLQILRYLWSNGMGSLQEALEAPRWYWRGGRRVSVEAGFDPGRARALVANGHSVEREPATVVFGRAQAVARTREGILMGASDPRADGQAQAL